MIGRILSMPLRAAKVAFRFVRPRKDARSDGPLAYTPASGGLKRPAEAVSAPGPAPADDDEHAGHSHSHGHSHDHGAQAAPAATPAATPAQVDVWAEQTPNPNARKFTVSGEKVVEKGSLSFNSKEEATGSELGEALYKVVGVRSIFAVNDFVTVTKEDDADWTYLEPAIINAIQSAF